MDYKRKSKWTECKLLSITVIHRSFSMSRRLDEIHFILKALVNCFIVLNIDSVGNTISYKCPIFFIWNYKLDLPKSVIDGVLTNFYKNKMPLFHAPRRLRKLIINSRIVQYNFNAKYRLKLIIVHQLQSTKFCGTYSLRQSKSWCRVSYEPWNDRN